MGSSVKTPEDVLESMMNDGTSERASSQLQTPPLQIGAFILHGDNQEILSVLSLKWQGARLNRSLGPFHSPARVSHPIGSIRFRWQEMINDQSLHQPLGVLHLSLQVIKVDQPHKEIVALNFNWETFTGQKEFLGVVVITDILQSRILGTLLLNLEIKNLSHNKPIGLFLLGWMGFNPRGNASRIQRLLDLRWIFFGDPELNDDQNLLLGSVDFDFQRIHPTASNDTFFGSISMLDRLGIPPANLSWSYDRNPPPLNRE
ncbi:hypothetical protein J5N97_008852 [Dioscorea zingiberensis]|uniref:Uncharacterized protein n=1 Tax=Dioscorea zingiberensis TaxID=325984 RepID=A0A9D5HLR9_9LILI|nr:hypothetical protein J5N97_008852 [Dioscorea zingiberensis]